MFYKQRFYKCFSELELTSYGKFFSDAELLYIMQQSKAQRSTPQEAAARAYRNLILSNPLVSLQEKLIDSFKCLDGTIRWWHFERKLNADLLENMWAIRDQLLREFVGEQYENSYYRYLSDIGLIVPIEHYMLGFAAKLNLLRQSIEDRSPACAAIILFKSEKWQEYEKQTVRIFRHQTKDNLEISNMAINCSAKIMRVWIDEDFSDPGTHFLSPEERLFAMTSAQSLFGSTPSGSCNSQTENASSPRADKKSLNFSDTNAVNDPDTNGINVEDLDLSLRNNESSLVASIRNAVSILGLQKAMIQGENKTIPIEATDSFSLGYIVGLCASVYIAINKAADSQKLDIHLRCVLFSLFGDNAVEALIAKIEERLRLQDSEIHKGVEVGKEELDTFLKYKAEGRNLVVPPMGWVFHCRKNS